VHTNHHATLLEVTRASLLNTRPASDVASVQGSLSASKVSRVATLLDCTDYPFNKTWSEAKKIGGKMVAADFTANVLIGTNLGACDSSTFNYVAQADTQGMLSLFGSQYQAFHASVAYGKDHGAAFADEVELTVFGKQVYQKSLTPIDVDCSEHTSSIPLKKHPGISVSHTLWAGPVPVTFAASASLDLSVTWGWHVCDADLSADLWIKPSATMQVSGSAKLNLLIIDASTELSVSTSTALRPVAHVSGTACNAGLELDLIRAPADSGTLHSFYDRRKCKLLFFDCKMEAAGDKTWWSWSEPAETKVLMNYTVPIPV